MQTISVVIPVYGNFRLLNDLLVCLTTYSAPEQIVIVDDCSPDEETLNGIKWWKNNYPEITTVRPLKNQGFLLSANQGMSIASGDILCLVSTDVIVETNISPILRHVLSDNPRTLIGGVVYQGSTGWNVFGSTVFPYAEGWFLSCTKDAWKEIGGFDERYVPNDFEDVDLSTTALSLGYELQSLNNPHVRHIGGQSIGYNEQREELTNRNRKIFEEKWITKRLQNG